MEVAYSLSRVWEVVLGLDDVKLFILSHIFSSTIQFTLVYLSYIMQPINPSNPAYGLIINGHNQVGFWAPYCWYRTFPILNNYPLDAFKGKNQVGWSELEPFSSIASPIKEVKC